MTEWNTSYGGIQSESHFRLPYSHAWTAIYNATRRLPPSAKDLPGEIYKGLTHDAGTRNPSKVDLEWRPLLDYPAPLTKESIEKSCHRVLGGHHDSSVEDRVLSDLEWANTLYKNGTSINAFLPPDLDVPPPPTLKFPTKAPAATSRRTGWSAPPPPYHPPQGWPASVSGHTWTAPADTSPTHKSSGSNSQSGYPVLPPTAQSEHRQVGWFDSANGRFVPLSRHNQYGSFRAPESELRKVRGGLIPCSEREARLRGHSTGQGYFLPYPESTQDGYEMQENQARSNKALRDRMEKSERSVTRLGETSRGLENHVNRLENDMCDWKQKADDDLASIKALVHQLLSQLGSFQGTRLFTPPSVEPFASTTSNGTEKCGMSFRDPVGTMRHSAQTTAV